jgi:hypothetical protein
MRRLWGKQHESCGTSTLQDTIWEIEEIKIDPPKHLKERACVKECMCQYQEEHRAWQHEINIEIAVWSLWRKHQITEHALCSATSNSKTRAKWHYTK